MFDIFQSLIHFVAASFRKGRRGRAIVSPDVCNLAEIGAMRRDGHSAQETFLVHPRYDRRGHNVDSGRVLGGKVVRIDLMEQIRAKREQMPFRSQSVTRLSFRVAECCDHPSEVLPSVGGRVRGHPCTHREPLSADGRLIPKRPAPHFEGRGFGLPAGRDRHLVCLLEGRGHL